jgi:uncharacterized membrane protein HdeD (DUF308 family)
MTAFRTLDRFSRSQLARGAVLASLGVAAINWPEVALPASMTAAGVFVALSGMFDIYVGRAARDVFRGWPVLAGHGAACVVFGVLTILLPHLPLGAAMALVALWLVLYGVMTAALALALWPMPRTRWTLLGVTVVVVPAGLLATTLADMPIFVPLYLGACFAAFLGVVHLAGGVWLRRVAMPGFAPTTQSRWAPPATPAGAHHAHGAPRGT